MADAAETHRRLVYLRSRAGYYRRQAEQSVEPEQVAFCRGEAPTTGKSGRADAPAEPNVTGAAGKSLDYFGRPSPTLRGSAIVARTERCRNCASPPVGSSALEPMS